MQKVNLWAAGAKAKLLSSAIYIKPTTINSIYHFAFHDELKQPLYYIDYNFAKGLKALKEHTPLQFVLNQQTIYPEYFTLNPNRFLLGINRNEIPYIWQEQRGKLIFN